MPVHSEDIILGGRRITIRIADIPLDDVELDPDNPRIKYRRDTRTGTDITTLDDLVWSMSGVKDLKKDIQLSGGLRERIYVQAHGDKFKVVEGNCRTACFRALREEDPDSDNWKKIPARILPADISEREVAILLSDWHVAGKIQWKAHEKAGYVYKMNSELGMPLEEIALHMRTSKSTIQRWKDAYVLMFETFLKMDRGKFAKMGERKWSYFDEFFKRPELRDKFKEDPAFGKTFARWVGNDRIGPPENVRKLSRIVVNETANEVFESGGGINEAFKIVQQEVPEEGSSFFTLLQKLRVACTSAASLEDVLRVRDDPVAQKRVLDTYTALVKFMKLADLDPKEVK